jgi:SOS response associated peptidase (SRAP)/[2Fe-2S] binding domain
VEKPGRASAITTIETIGATAAGAKIQRAWLDREVVQCGYCQSGQIMSAAVFHWRHSRVVAATSASEPDRDCSQSGFNSSSQFTIAFRRALRLRFPEVPRAYGANCTTGLHDSTCPPGQSMCGRVIQSSGPVRLAIVDGLDVRDSRSPRWNGASSHDLLVIRCNRKSGQGSLDPLRWGLIHYWCGDSKGGRKPINAKRETVHTLPTFRDAYERRRCIVPVDGFFEWKAIKEQRAKHPTPSP